MATEILQKLSSEQVVMMRLVYPIPSPQRERGVEHEKWEPGGDN